MHAEVWCPATGPSISQKKKRLQSKQVVSSSVPAYAMYKYTHNQARCIDIGQSHGRGALKDQGEGCRYVRLYVGNSSLEKKWADLLEE